MATNVWRHMIKNSNFKQFTIAKLGGSSYRVDHGAYAPGESHVLPGHAPPFGTFLLSLSQLLVSSRGKPRTVCRAHCFTVHWSRVGGVAWGPCLVEEDNVVPALPVLMLGPRSVDACSSTSAHLHIRWCRRLKKAAFSMLSGTSTCTPGLCSGLYACVKFGQLHAFVPGLGRKRNLRKRQLLSLAWSYPALVFGHLERRSAPPPTTPHFSTNSCVALGPQSVAACSTTSTSSARKFLVWVEESERQFDDWYLRSSRRPGSVLSLSCAMNWTSCTRMLTAPGVKLPLEATHSLKAVTGRSWTSHVSLRLELCAIQSRQRSLLRIQPWIAWAKPIRAG